MRFRPMHGEVTVRFLVLFLLVLPHTRAAQCPSPPADRQTLRARFEEYEKAAQEAFQRRDFVDAAKNLRGAICIEPTSARAYHELGLAEAAAGHFEEADRALALAQRHAPRDFGILLSRAQVELSLQKPDLARLMLSDARRNQPKDSRTGAQALARVDSLVGRSYMEQQQPDLAIAAWLRAADGGGPEAESLLLLATLENSLGAYDDAIQNADRVMRSGEIPDGQKGAAAAIAGLAYKNQKLNDDAIRLLRQAILTSPNQTSYLALAEIYAANDQPQEAGKVLTQARTVFPDSAKIAVALGRNLAGSDPSGALEVLKECTRRTPDDPEAWRWQAEVQTSLGQMKEAAESLQQIARRSPDYPMIHKMVAQALLKVEPVDYADALRALERGGKASPDDPEIYYMRGKILAEQGRYEDAVVALQRAVELGPTLATPYYQLGLVYQKLGWQSQAAEQFERFKFLKSTASE
jgi:superkiller protein 3